MSTLTVSELLKFLQEAVNRDPDVLEYTLAEASVRLSDRSMQVCFERGACGGCFYSRTKKSMSVEYDRCTYLNGMCSGELYGKGVNI